MTTGRGRRGAHFDQAQVLFGGEALAGLGGEGRRGDGLDKELGNLSGGVAVHRAVDADDPAECRDRVASQRLPVGLHDIRSGGRAAGVGVLHDDRCWLVKLLRQLPAGVQIDEVVEAEFLALELASPGDSLPRSVGVKRGALMGIFSIAQGLRQRHVDTQGGRQARSIQLRGRIRDWCFSNPIQRIGDGGVVGRGRGEGLPRQPPASLPAQAAAFGLQLFDESRIIGDAGHDGHVFKVFGRRAHHRRAADVDVFNQVPKSHAGLDGVPNDGSMSLGYLSGSLLKGVEVDHHHVDGLDALRGDGSLMLLVAANVKQAAMNLGVQRLDAAVEHLRKAGQIADVLYDQAGLAQRARRSAGGNQLHAKARQHLGKLHQAGLVGHAQQRPPDPLFRNHIRAHDFAPFLGHYTPRNPLPNWSGKG